MIYTRWQLISPVKKISIKSVEMCTQIGHTSKWLHLISHLHFASAWQCLRAILEHHKLSRAHWYIICNFKELPILFFFYHKECFTKCKGDARCRGTLYRTICGRAAARSKAAFPIREWQVHSRQFCTAGSDLSVKEQNIHCHGPKSSCHQLHASTGV